MGVIYCATGPKNCSPIEPCFWLCAVTEIFVGCTIVAQLKKEILVSSYFSISYEDLIVPPRGFEPLLRE